MRGSRALTVLMGCPLWLLAQEPATSASAASFMMPVHAAAAEVAAPPAGATHQLLVHTASGGVPGTSGWLIANDPFTALARGQAVFTHAFTAAEGAGGRPLRGGAPGVVVSSCVACHALDARDATRALANPGHETPFRRAPRLEGVGLIEQLGEAIRRRLLALVDRDGNGYVTADEAMGLAARIPVMPEDPHSPWVDFGQFADADGDGIPDLNPAVSVWYVDAHGWRVSGATSLRGPGVVGYAFAISVFGWGDVWPRPEPTGVRVRAVVVGAFAHHAGIQADDPTLAVEPLMDGWAGTSITGVRQVFAGAPPDPGIVRAEDGTSLDDPDHDGVVEELGPGDIDLVEWFLAHQARPPRGVRSQGTLGGERQFAQMGCTQCHVSDWSMPEMGDRQLPHGESARTMTTIPVPARVQGIYSDFAYHDLGSACREMQPDGRVLTRFRTAPLWGVGVTRGFGHDGASPDLDAIIRRHGGEAAGALLRYEDATPQQREEVWDFLMSLGLPHD